MLLLGNKISVAFLLLGKDEWNCKSCLFMYGQKPLVGCFSDSEINYINSSS